MPLLKAKTLLILPLLMWTKQLPNTTNWAMLTDHTETAWERKSQQKHLRYKSCWDGFSV